MEFIAVDNPHANKLTVHILAAVAQHEREIISARTSAALKAAKARGKRLGKSETLRGTATCRGGQEGEGRPVLGKHAAGDPAKFRPVA